MKIGIDPGHGMANRRPGQYDPGAVWRDVTEAGVALDWALTLKHYLTAAGIGVWLSRPSDRYPVPVGVRAGRAMTAECSHFVSLHCNAASGAATGVETFYRGAEDLPWARLVHAAALEATGLKDRGIKSEGQSQHSRLAVLDFRGAACLVELGFITHAQDRVKLLSRDVRIAFAEALVRRLAGKGK